MNLRLKTAFCLNALVSAGLMASGLRYLLSPQVMPYHLQVINRSWGDLDSRLQIMLLGFLKLGGAGMLTVGAAIALLLIPFSYGHTWAHRAILVISIVYSALVFYIAHSLHYSTGASTPWSAGVIMMAVAVTAYLLTIGAERKPTPIN